MITEDDLRDYFRATTQVDERARDRVLSAVTSSYAARPDRRKLAMLSGVGIAGAVAATAVVAGLAGGHASSTSPGGSAPPSHTASESGPKPSPTPSRAVLTRMTPAQIEATFESLLPVGWHVVSANTDDVGAGETWVNVVIDDGHGAAAVSITLEYPPKFDYETAPVGCKDDPSLGWPASACTDGPDGTQVLAVKTYEYPADPSRGAKEWIVEAWQPWPFAVGIHEWNAPSEKDSAVTREDPPLTLDELRKIALAPAWTG